MLKKGGWAAGINILDRQCMHRETSEIHATLKGEFEEEMFRVTGS